MGGKHRKSRYDSSSSSDSDTFDSSSLESSDSEVPFVLNHSHRHKSQDRIKKSKHKKNKKHKKDKRYRSSSSDSSESCEHKHKKHKHYGSKHHKKQKHHTNSNPNRTDDKERHGNRNFDDWYYQDRIAYHSERDKFDDRYHYRDQGSYDRSPKADSYDRYYGRYRDRDRYYGRDIYDRGGHFADHSHDETVGYHSERQVNSKYKRELRHVSTEQCFQPQHSINHQGYPVYHTNYQYAEPTLSVPSQNPDLIKDVVSNQQMINYHLLTSPVYLGPYHQSDSMSSNHNHVGSTPMASFQGVSYQANGSRSSYFSSPMTNIDYPSQTDSTMITTPSADVVCGTTSLSQEQVSMDYHHQFMLMFLQQLHTFTPMITRSLIVNPLLFSLKVCILMNMPAYMRKNTIWNTKRTIVTVTLTQQTSLQITLTIHYMQLLLNTPLWQIGCMNSLNK